MEFTGERPTLEHEIQSSRIRYKTIIPYCINKRVLDIGCGVGHGSYLLSHFALHVTGIDVSFEAISEAKQTFKASNLTYLHSKHLDNISELHVNLISMVEVFEHIEPELVTNFLTIAAKIKEIVLTTPNGDLFTYHPATKEERRGYHVWHYTREELIELFGKYYKFVEIYAHIFDPQINQYTSYMVYATNHENWDWGNSWLTKVRGPE